MGSYLTVADLLAMPHLGLQLAAGAEGCGRSVLWTHTSELDDPGPWLEGGELLVVNGFGIPPDPEGQVEYLARLAHHRLAGLAASVRAPELTREMLAEADRLAFPVLRIPREVPFIEVSHLVANASERSAGRLSRHLRIFETLRLRNSLESNVAKIYSQLEQVSGYRLALVSPAGYPLLQAWDWVPADLKLGRSGGPADQQAIPGGYALPLLVGDRVTAYLVGKEHPGAIPGGLAALQHVSTVASLDAIDDQRRREAFHREGSALLSRALEEGTAGGTLEAEFNAVGLDLATSMRVLAFGERPGGRVDEIEVRDWLADRALPHVLLRQGSLLAIVGFDEDVLHRLATGLGVHIGASMPMPELNDVPRMRRQALWSLNIAGDSPEAGVVLAEHQLGLARWITPDVEAMRHLASGTLQPIKHYDAEHGTELLHTLSVYFHNQGRLRPAAAQLFVHEHTLSYRLRRIEQLTGRRLKTYRDVFELWLAVDMRFLLDEE